MRSVVVFLLLWVGVCYFGGVPGILFLVWLFVLLGIDYGLSGPRPYEPSRLVGGFCVLAAMWVAAFVGRGVMHGFFLLLSGIFGNRYIKYTWKDDLF